MFTIDYSTFHDEKPLRSSTIWTERRRGNRRFRRRLLAHPAQDLGGGMRLLSRYVRTLTLSSMNRNGLAIKSFPPLMLDLARLSKSLNAVTKMTGVVL